MTTDTLAERLITRATRQYEAKLSCIEANRARIDAFDALLHRLGGDSDGVGEYIDSVVVHDHTQKVSLRLQLCALGQSVEWVNRHIADIEARLGQRLAFTMSDGSAYAEVKECDTITIVISDIPPTMKQTFTAAEAA